METVTTQDIANEKKRREKKARRRRRATWIIVLLLLLAACAGGYWYLQYHETEETVKSVTTYTATAVQAGQIRTTLSGSGTLTAAKSGSFSAPGENTVIEKVHAKTGETLREGDVLMTLTCEETREMVDELTEELETTNSSLATTTRVRSSLSVTATRAGIVKNITVSAGDLADDAEYLCMISTDGTMKITIPLSGNLRLYDTVLCLPEGMEETEGLVTGIDEANGTATIFVKDSAYSCGTPCEITTEEGVPLGKATIEINEHITIEVSSGKIASVDCTENQKVSRGKRLFTLAEGAPTEAYLKLVKEREDLLQQIEDLNDMLTIRAPYDCMLTSLSVAEGDTVSAGASLCSIAGTDGFTMSLNIDELDISTVEHGQTAVVTLDAISGSYGAVVSNVSYSGSGSYVTSYSVSLLIDPIPGAYPGMSASAEITVSSSEGLILPAGAIRYDGRGSDRKAYVYKADDSVEAGAVLDEDSLDLESQTKVYVETGMSDGSYLIVTSDDLKAGDCIWQTNLRTTAVYSSGGSSAASSSGFSFGGMASGSGGSSSGSGGGMPGGFGGGMPGGFGGGMPGGSSFGGGSGNSGSRGSGSGGSGSGNSGRRNPNGN